MSARIGRELDAVYRAVPAAVGQIRCDVTRAAMSSGTGAGSVAKIKLAVSEAATNVVLHAYRNDNTPGDIRVVVEPADGVLEITIGDNGIGMSARTDSPGAGLGLGIIGCVADHCVITSSPGHGTRILMFFAINSISDVHTITVS